MLWEQGEQAGSEGSKLGARGASWGLPEAPGRFQGPRHALGARGASWEWGEQAGSKGSKLGASWGPSKVPRTQGCSGSKGSKLGASWGPREVPGTQGCSGSKESEGSKLGVREESWGLPSLLAPTEVVGTLKHSITYPSSLPLLPAHSLRSQLASSSLPGSEPPGETFTTWYFNFDLLQSQVVQCVSPVVQLSSEASEWVRPADAADFPSRLTYGSGVNNSLSLLYFLSKIKDRRHCRILGDTWMEQFILWLKWDTTDCRITTYLILCRSENRRREEHQ